MDTPRSLKSTIIMSLGLVGLGIGRAINIPSTISNLTQTLQSSTLMDTEGNPVFTLGSGGQIDIPTGALRDRSVLPEDIDGFVQVLDQYYSCGDGQILVGIQDGAKVCKPLERASLWSTQDGGERSIYYKPQTLGVLSGSSIYVGITPNPNNDFGAINGLVVKGDAAISDSISLGDNSLVLGGPADSRSAARVTHDYDLVIGQAANAYVGGKMVSLGTDVTHQGAITVGGTARVDGGRYLVNSPSAPQRTAMVMAHLENSTWLTSRSKKNKTAADSVIVRNTPHLAIGGQSSTAQLAVEGDIEIVGGRENLTLSHLKDAAPVGQLSPTSTVDDECVALSLDSEGEVVLVNICK